jgi:hypothetical protein
VQAFPTASEIRPPPQLRSPPMAYQGTETPSSASEGVIKHVLYLVSSNTRNNHISIPVFCTYIYQLLQQREDSINPAKIIACITFDFLNQAITCPVGSPYIISLIIIYIINYGLGAIIFDSQRVVFLCDPVSRIYSYRTSVL